MKQIFSGTIFVLLATVLLAQQSRSITKTIPLKSTVQTFKADMQYGDLHINVVNTNSIKVEVFIDINDGEWNDAYELDIVEESGYVKVEGNMDMSIFENRNTYSKDRWGSWNQKEAKDEREVVIAGKTYTYEKSPYKERKGINVDVLVAITLPQSLNLDIKTTYGSSRIENLKSNIVVDATYGSVDVIFDRNINASHIELSSTYSSVDVSVPSNLQADLKMKSGYGEIYSNLEFSPTFINKNKECWFGDEINAKLNGGGPLVEINSGYSNLYLRKL